MLDYVEMCVAYARCRLNIKNELGAAGVEYGLLVALIAAVIIGTVATLGGKVDTGFSTVNGKLP